MTDTITTTSIGVSPLAGNIGAEITGVDAGSSPSDDAVARVRQALLDHKVVFLRDQDLDYTRQVAFAVRLGPLTLGHPTLESPPGQPRIHYRQAPDTGRTDDVSAARRQPAVLRSIAPAAL